MARVVRARLSRHPLAVWVPEQHEVPAFRLLGLPGQDEEVLLWEAQTRAAELLGDLPERLIFIVFRDASITSAEA